MSFVDGEKAAEVLGKIDVELLVAQIDTLDRCHQMLLASQLGSLGPDADDHFEGLLNLLGAVRDLVDP